MNTDAVLPQQHRKLHAWWRASNYLSLSRANYLSVSQIYLFDNLLLNRPPTRAEVKRMLLGHWVALASHAWPANHGKGPELQEVGSWSRTRSDSASPAVKRS